jgi:hypothetical protein
MLFKNGGYAQVLKMHAQFHALLNKKHFFLSSGMLYLSNSLRLSPAYQNLRMKLFRAGLIFPRHHGSPVALSFSHTHEILKKSAQKINQVLHDFLT